VEGADGRFVGRFEIGDRCDSVLPKKFPNPTGSSGGAKRQAQDVKFRLKILLAVNWNNADKIKLSLCTSGHVGSDHFEFIER
jgi:hypothetical protein